MDCYSFFLPELSQQQETVCYYPARIFSFLFFFLTESLSKSFSFNMAQLHNKITAQKRKGLNFSFFTVKSMHSFCEVSNPLGRKDPFLRIERNPRNYFLSFLQCPISMTIIWVYYLLCSLPVMPFGGLVTSLLQAI